MMNNIDDIIDMLNWNNEEKVQINGLRLASQVRNMNVFFQPLSCVDCKSTWNNCAIIISEKEDFDLYPYLMEMFEWLKDMNWPGAQIIFERLKRFRKDTYFLKCKEESEKIAQI